MPVIVSRYQDARGRPGRLDPISLGDSISMSLKRLTQPATRSIPRMPSPESQ